MSRLLAHTLAILFTLGVVHAVEITPQADKSLLAKGSNYTATVDATGHLTSLKVNNADFFTGTSVRTTAGGKDTPQGGTVSTEGSTITATIGGAHIRWAFTDTGIDVATDGAALWYDLSPSVTALVLANGQALSGTQTTGDVRKLVAGPVAISIDQPFHRVHEGFFPSILTRSGKAETPFKCHIECGVTVAPLELISLVSLNAEGHDPKFPPAVAAGQKATFTLDLQNLGAGDVPTAVHFRTMTHVDYATPDKPVSESTLPVTVPAGKHAPVSLELAFPAPGLYWVNAEILDDGKVLKSARLGVIYDGDNFRPPLTRPADFKQFWDAKLAAMRAVPFNATMTENKEKSNERFIHYDFEINDAKGQRMKTFLRVPRAPGPYEAEVHTYWGSSTPDEIVKEYVKVEKEDAGVGEWHRGGDRLRVGAPQPESSTYTRWAGRDDNNCLDSYLMQVRMEDYLRSRPDVKNIWLFGGSRSGASMLVAAALSPERVVACSVTVPTCCGISWADRPYHGWGNPPRGPDGLKIAAYFDPVNFAQDIKVPIILDGGLYDTLAPPAGILAFYNEAVNAPFKRLGLDLGGHGYFPPEHRKQADDDLADYLKSHPYVDPAGK